VLDQDRERAGPLEYRPTGEEPVRDAAQRVEIRSVIEVSDAVDCFRRHELRGARGNVGSGERRVGRFLHLHQPEVEHLEKVH
jgi:hypothetical protein